MKCASLALALGAAIFGLLAAYYWYRSSRIDIHALPAEKPGDPSLHMMLHLGDTLGEIAKGADFNKWAAIWTALSVLLSAGSAVASALSN